MSTNFNVIQAQRDLAIARNNELESNLQHQLSVVAFEAAQKTGNVVQVLLSPLDLR